MPEEVNRVITDHISDYLMVSEESGLINLKNEGIEAKNTFFVGNIMIETLIRTQEKWQQIETDFIEKDAKYFAVTFHRPENVDFKDNLKIIVDLLNQVSKTHKVIFPIHPRTKKQLTEFGFWSDLENNKQIIITEPLDYFTFLKSISKAACVITDSGGIQEETSFLNIPCITLRKNTERPVTTTNGTNKLCSINDSNLVEEIYKHIEKINNQPKTEIQYWDANVSERIYSVIKSIA